MTVITPLHLKLIPLLVDCLVGLKSQVCSG